VQPSISPPSCVLGLQCTLGLLREEQLRVNGVESGETIRCGVRLTAVEAAADRCDDNLNSEKSTQTYENRAVLIVDGMDSDNVNRCRYTD
jgi:hypothetical protein